MRRAAILFVLCINLIAHSTDIGSDTAVERFQAQQILENGDRIAGFAAIENGFALKGSFVTGTFDCLFPLTGRIDLNAGTLVLDKNIYLDHVSSIGTLGNITGNDRLFELSSSVTAVSILTDDAYNCAVFLLDELLAFDKTESVDWSWDSNYIAVASDVVETSSALAIYSFNGATLSEVLTTTVDATVSIGNEVRWHPSQYVLAFVRDDSTSGDELFTFSFVPESSELIQLSSDEIGNHAKAIAWHPTGNYLAVGTFDNSAEVIIYPVNNGVLDTGSKLSFDVDPNRNVQNETLDWDSTGDYLAVGYNSNGSDSELEVYVFTPSPLGLTLNASKDIGQRVRGLDWNPTYTYILAIGVDDAASDHVEVYAHDNSTGSLHKLVGLSLGARAEGIDWHPSGDCLAVGRNKVDGAGVFRTYAFDKDAPSLILASSIDFSKNIQAVRWAPDGLHVASGEDDGFEIGVFKLIRNLCFTVTDLQWIINDDVLLKNCCLMFSGNSTIQGRGNVLTFDPSCIVKIGENAQLNLVDITIKGLTSSSLQLTHDSSSLLLENAKLKLDASYSFTVGALGIHEDVHIIGGDEIFAYQSDQPLTIQEQSSLILDEDLTFSYDASASNLLKFSANNSKIILDGATLHATSNGLQLIGGKIKVRDDSFISSEILDTGNGFIDNSIIFGSGVKTDDCKLILLPNVDLTCSQGSIRYKNAKASSLKIRNDQSFLHFATDTTLWLYEDIDVSPGGIIFDDQSRLMRTATAQITGAVEPVGTLIRGTFAS